MTADHTRPGPTRVLLVDDDPLVRTGLQMVLASAEDLEVVGEVGDGAEAVDAVHRHRPDVVPMDVLTNSDLDEHVFGALRAGASGFLLKDTPPRELVAAVRVVAAGEAMLSPR